MEQTGDQGDRDIERLRLQLWCHLGRIHRVRGRYDRAELQMVGETGWQLSHGERSRLFMARAMLQNADLVVLDESFAALDPEALRQCLRCVCRRAATLLVIAHP